MKCPSCTSEVPAESRFCNNCGAPLASASQMPTQTAESPSTPAADAGAPMISSPVGRLISSGPMPAGGFTPGMVLAGRYRIIGLLGRGGMGEVYRADDLKLGQAVALKFLPKGLADDPVRRERFYAEVRIARQVSHPNICRVYDVSELDGRHFLTMEYIDGEDLASLLKRISSLHGTKALDVARQLCAGLAAAHNKGVLHRDLMPANVMIDGRGHVRITDFGLAVAAGEEVPAGDVSGTPAYMAPEQFAGKGASVRSDIYALGLVLYELYTGRRAFEAKSLAELRAKKEGAPPAAPAEIARDIDPIVERVILRCFERDPRQRPASAVQVAAALPGGDPLAAALAAGETPSPEMVAASGSTEGLRPWIAWACLAFVILGIGAGVLLARQAALVQRVPMDAPPDVLVKTARDILRSIGYPEPPADSAFGFETSPRYLNLQKVYQSATHWDNPPAFAIQFWYRQSPELLEHWGLGVAQSAGVTGGVDSSNPPLVIPGESVIWLDARGNLTKLRVIPPEEHQPSSAVQPPDWSALFRAAGINPAKSTPVEPDRTPQAYAETRAAWTGMLPDRPELPMRIEAAAYGGKPVSWRMIIPSWDDPSTGTTHSSANPGDAAANIIGIFLTLVVIAGGAFFARRNLRTGRGDRRGAARLACFVFVALEIAWVFAEHHVPAQAELDLFIMSASSALFNAGLLWLMYIALEPFVRRRWPGLMITWSRVLAGSFRDPLVGRDLLAGCVLGVVWALLNFLRYPVFPRFGATHVEPEAGVFLGTLYLFSGARAIVAGTSGLLYSSILIGLALLFLLFLLRVLLRSTWVAAVAFILIMTARFGLPGDSSLIFLIYIVLFIGMYLFILLRFGPVTFAATMFFACILLSFPITMQLSAWYSGIGLAGLGMLLALSLYAFHTSLGGQPLFGKASLGD
ncbi:MAG: protein kinase [Acidobacteriia bacterium]|nr:protein kinase [Terriglobia bacterium]